MLFQADCAATACANTTLRHAFGVRECVLQLLRLVCDISMGLTRVNRKGSADRVSYLFIKMN